MTVALPHPLSQLVPCSSITPEWFQSFSAQVSQVNTNTTNIATNTAAIAQIGYGRFAVNRNAVDQTLLTAAAFNKISFTTELLDADGVFDNVTNFRYLPLVSGWYFIGLAIGAAGGVADAPEAGIYKTGSLYASGSYSHTGTAAGFQVSVVSTLVQLNGSSDYIEGFVYLPAAVTTLSGRTDTTAMFGWRVSA